LFRFAAKGFLYAKVLLPGDKLMHLMNTHLQAGSQHPAEDRLDCYGEIRRQQLQKLVDFIAQKLQEESFKEMPFLICGDLNINARLQLPQKSDSLDIYLEDPATPSFEYSQMMALFNEKIAAALQYEMSDILYDKLQRHPITFGVPGERALTEKTEWDSSQRLDYMLWGSFKLPLQTLKKSDSVISLSPPRVHDCQVLPLKIHITGTELSQLSDHCALAIELE
jgi:endonuclease/exonuclease/phosphatase family metal-dependent hydrolase